MFPRPSRLAEVLRDGGVALGSLTLLQEPAIGEILGVLGYDFLVVDTEHAAADEQSVLAMVRAAGSAGTTPLVRLRRIEEKDLLWSLDSGAGGVVLPLVETGAQAVEAARLTHYPPVGDRTLCSAARAAGHGTARGDFDRYLTWAGRNTTVVALVETPAGLANLDDILAADLDVLMLGRADLSVKLGLGYQPTHPEVEKHAVDFVERVVAAGRVAGMLAYSAEEARRWIDRGVRFVVYSQPEMLLSDAYRRARDEILGGTS
ncbi:HpcH/HpaI aldolase family protein [Micromonospora wenchangensis]|uniref:HpcH/HpaI aldolase family protein n=1 Tax=Micromonospora wenchangensis TaxID=1185415 RepID=UPI003D71FEEF